MGVGNDLMGSDVYYDVIKFLENLFWYNKDSVV